jgi:hypothetical protein
VKFIVPTNSRTAQTIQEIKRYCPFARFDDINRVWSIDDFRANDYDFKQLLSNERIQIVADDYSAKPAPKAVMHDDAEFHADQNPWTNTSGTRK